MRKFLLFSAALLLTAESVVSQTIVSTEVENKKVVLEEFTGIHCGYCPQGHAIAQSIQNAHPEDVFLINIHTGSYSTPGTGEPDFRTSYGTAISGQSGLTGYPAGTVNRHLFSGLSQGSGTAMSRDKWTNASNQTLAMQAGVNVGIESDINAQTRELTVHVEVYYTADNSQTTNYLNVALLQNNTLGPQSGGNMGNEYVHMHRLVELITGTWGEEITTTTTGSFIDKIYTYTIPEGYRSIPAVIEDLEIVAFVTETRQEIANAAGCVPTFSNFENQNDASIIKIETPKTICGDMIAPEVTIQNMGEQPLTELIIEYSLNDGSEHSYSWSGEISSLHKEVILLPEVQFEPADVNSVAVLLPTDDNTNNNLLNIEVQRSVESTTTVSLSIYTDAYPDELSWSVKNSSGSVMYSGSGYATGSRIHIDQTFALPDDCYTFEVTDSYGDGINYNVSNSYLYLTDSEEFNLMTYPTGAYGAGDIVHFSTKTASSISQNTENSIKLYPNPTSDNLYFPHPDFRSAQLFDVSGRLLTTTDKSEIDVRSYPNGVYFIKINLGGTHTVESFNVSK